jgi:spore germination cell wall hydrolase CwlJ-like protein
LNTKIINQTIGLITTVLVILLAVYGCVFAGKQYFNYKIDSLKNEKVKLSNFTPTTQTRLKELDCLATNIYYEAGNQSFEGKVAVAQVTLNRVADGRFGKTICEVVYAKSIVHGKILCQFSWVCENKRRPNPVHLPQYQESMEVAKKVLLEHFRLPSLTNSLYFHADYVRPGWRKERLLKIGRHIFYKG